MDILFINNIVTGVMTVMLIAVAVMLFYNRLWAAREKEADAASKNQTNRLAIILQTGKLSLWTYKIDERCYYSISETGDYTKEYIPIDFAQFFDRDDFELMRKAIFDISNEKTESKTLRIKSAPNAEGGQNSYDVNISIVERDDKGRAKALLGVQHDVTDTLKREQEISQLLMRYHTVFNSALSDMIYYDKDGRLSDINDKACKSFSTDDKRGLLFSNLRIQDNPIVFDSIDLSRPDDIRTTAILGVDKLEAQGYHLNSSDHKNKFYYESSITPVINAEGNLEGIYVSGRNVTEMVESFHRQQEGVNQLRIVHKNIQDYIQNINYALRVSDVRLVNYYPDTYTFEISSNVNQSQLCLSQVRCIRLASPQFRKNVSILLNRMDHRNTMLIEQAIQIDIHDRQGRPIWLLFNMVPVYVNGKVERYFGMCRNITEMIETERRLAVETKKAQETEELKQAFLTNMSYEIRTPLNTVVGFAELFEAEHDPADEPVFVEQIKKNSNQLLNLVNDILFLSRLDANMIESLRSEADFALFFESCCQLGLSNAKPEVKTIIENDYEHLIVNIDLENVGKMIQRACALASAYTQKGTIRCKYEYWHNELIIVIEDTGVGIDAEKLPDIFNRFNHNSGTHKDGTGLDMPIIKALANMMGGDIEALSEKGKGTTVRITIPCEATLVEKKRNEEVINDK